MRSFSFSSFSLKAAEAFKRFPIALIWAILGTIFFIVLIEQDERLIYKEYQNISLVLILGVSWLIATQFYIEQFKKKGLWWIKCIILLLLLVIYFTLPEYSDPDRNTNDIPYIRWFLYLIAGHITLFFAPFLTVWHPKAYWNYLANMMIALARSALYSGVLYLGLVLAMLAVRFLFDIDIKDTRYFQLFIICLGIVNTWVYLTDFPKEIQHNIHLKFPKPAAIFVKFILIPLAVLYIVILYAYGAKIMLQWELPKGWVSYLVTALVGLLLVIQCIIHPVRRSHESRLIRRFHPLAYYLLMPLLALLYAAIYKRISDYGITEARYFLILVAIFITISTVYLITSSKQQLRYLPMLLAALVIFSSFGSWGAFSVSQRSQVNEFEEVYTAFAKASPDNLAAQTVKSFITEDSLQIAQEKVSRFISITKYLHQRDALHKTEPILGFNPVTAFPETGYWQIGNKILDTLGIKRSTVKPIRKYFNYQLKETPVLAVASYDFFTELEFYGRNNQEENDENQYGISILKENDRLIVKKDNSELIEIPLEPFIKTLPKGQEAYEELALEDLTILEENTKAIVGIVFKNIELEKDEDDYTINSSKAYILIKLK